MPNKKLLESYPLYRSMQFESPAFVHELPRPALNFECPNCGSSQTYNMRYDRYVGVEHTHPRCTEKVVTAIYLCNGCGADQREFFLYVSPDRQTITKVGQYPARTLAANRDIEKLLGDHREYLRRGQVCEGQGYGIGAFAYYRRIVEEVIDELLTKVSDLIDPSERATYQHALETVKATRVAAEKIDLVKDMIPAILRPNDINPLRALHEALSEGLHSQTDEECLELAEIVRDSLIFLATQINISTSATSAFTSSMKKLLEKKAARGS